MPETTIDRGSAGCGFTAVYYFFMLTPSSQILPSCRGLTPLRFAILVSHSKKLAPAFEVLTGKYSTFPLSSAFVLEGLMNQQALICLSCRSSPARQSVLTSLRGIM